MSLRFERFSLLWGETPLQPLPRFAEAIGAASCWIKRDDLTGIGLGGNKLRKLEFLIGDALAQGCDLIITGGSPQSNHARLTAAVCGKAGLETWLCFSGSEQGEVQGNLLLDHVMGAKIFSAGVYGSDNLLKAMEEKAAEAREMGKRPYVMPVGGSTVRGDYGYVVAWQELQQQRERMQIPPFDEVYVTVGSGGTLAGVVVGHSLSPTSTQLKGISVWMKQKQIAPELGRLTRELMLELGEEEKTISPYTLFDSYIGTKYGTPSPAGNDAIRLLAQTEGLFVDPIYTGKALAGMIDQVKQNGGKHILFWHTGGTPALFTHANSFR